METIQVVLGAKLLKAADIAARRQKINRSALIREALESHLQRQRVKALEEQERRGYESHPQRADDVRAWEDAIAWPED